MKLDVDVLRYLTKDDFRVLTAVEMGMRNVSDISLIHPLYVVFEIPFCLPFLNFIVLTVAA